MDPATRELATAAVEALQLMAANSSNRLGTPSVRFDRIRAVDHAQRQRGQGRAEPCDNKGRS